MLNIEGFEQLDIVQENRRSGKNNEQILRLLNWLLIKGEMEVYLEDDEQAMLENIVFKDMATHNPNEMVSQLKALLRKEINV